MDWNVFRNSNVSEDKYLDRCVTLKRYKITVYVEDEATAEQLYNDIMEYYENIGYESEIEETIFVLKAYNCGL